MMLADLGSFRMGGVEDFRNFINAVIDEMQLKVVTKRAPAGDELADLRFAWAAVMSVKSNAILLANVDTVSRDITVTMGGTEKGVYTLGPSQSTFVTYSGLAGGPIVVSSATGAKIIASLYELRRDPTLAGWNGQNEMMGLPWEQLSDTYLIPMYFGALKPSVLDVSLFIAVP